MTNRASTGYKQVLRDIRTGEFLTASGGWSRDEGIAANWISACRILQFCRAHPERNLELVLKSPGEPDLSVSLSTNTGRPMPAPTLPKQATHPRRTPQPF